MFFEPLKMKEEISVTKFVSQVSQPRGGYISRKQLNKIELTGACALDFGLENIHPILVGITVDYLARYMLFGNKNESFAISIRGSLNVGELNKAMSLIEKIDTSLSDICVINACKLAGYDVAFRRGPDYFKSIDSINPDDKCIENIKAMVYRTVVFFKSVNVIDSGMTFEGGYTNKISRGDADYLSEDTVWDLKVLCGEPNKNHTLQLFVYAILLKRTPKYKSLNVNRIGIFNPRFNCAYTFWIDELDKVLFDEIHELVGN